jgi:hypothetical protein
MTDSQVAALQKLCANYNVPFVPENYGPAFDLPAGWVIGWVGPIYVGCSPEGDINS